MAAIKNIKGLKFGRLTPIRMLDSRLSGYVAWECECDCGEVIKVQSGHLQSGHTQSCGCYKSDRIKETHRTVSYYNKRLSAIWSKMKERCDNPNCISYKYYGGKGVKVCDLWHNDFSVFCEWALVNGYKSDLSIERVDITKNYDPSNCKWIPLNEQQKNRSNCIYIEDEDSNFIILEDFSRKYNISRGTIKYRYTQGDRGERLIRPVSMKRSEKNKYKNEWLKGEK